jgi:hypothetical protein
MVCVCRERGIVARAPKAAFKLYQLLGRDFLPFYQLGVVQLAPYDVGRSLCWLPEGSRSDAGETAIPFVLHAHPSVHHVAEQTHMKAL